MGEEQKDELKVVIKFGKPLTSTMLKTLVRLGFAREWKGVVTKGVFSLEESLESLESPGSQENEHV